MSEKIDALRAALEPLAVDAVRIPVYDTDSPALFSIAVSLKRIADALERQVADARERDIWEVNF